MKHIIIAILSLLAVSLRCHAVFEPDAHSGWECALASPHLAVLPGLLPGSNPALPFEGVELAIRRGYGLCELSRYSVGLGTRWSGSTLSVCASQLGGDLYREVTACIGVAHSYNDKLNFGARLKLLWLEVPKLVSETAQELDIGVHSSLLPGFSVGASISNALASMTDSAGPTSSVSMALGSNEAMIIAGAVQSRRGVRASIGGAVELNRHASVLAGISSHPSQLSFGLVINVRRLSFVLATEWHPELGLSESFGVRFAAVEDFPGDTHR